MCLKGRYLDISVYNDIGILKKTKNNGTNSFGGGPDEREDARMSDSVFTFGAKDAERYIDRFFGAESCAEKERRPVGTRGLLSARSQRRSRPLNGAETGSETSASGISGDTRTNPAL